mmetsp:Transcript_19946/g.50464  ORF Transcript_19946/g.50464 Transcript_19946/m.50464 type:complete len:364 (+) Transcript_19946:2314-3405(+)
MRRALHRVETVPDRRDHRAGQVDCVDVRGALIDACVPRAALLHAQPAHRAHRHARHRVRRAGHRGLHLHLRLEDGHLRVRLHHHTGRLLDRLHGAPRHRVRRARRDCRPHHRPPRRHPARRVPSGRLGHRRRGLDRGSVPLPLPRAPPLPSQVRPVHADRRRRRLPLRHMRLHRPPRRARPCRRAGSPAPRRPPRPDRPSTHAMLKDRKDRARSRQRRRSSTSAVARRRDGADGRDWSGAPGRRRRQGEPGAEPLPEAPVPRRVPARLRGASRQRGGPAGAEQRGRRLGGTGLGRARLPHARVRGARGGVERDGSGRRHLLLARRPVRLLRAQGAHRPRDPRVHGGRRLLVGRDVRAARVHLL